MFKRSCLLLFLFLVIFSSVSSVTASSEQFNGKSYSAKTNKKGVAKVIIKSNVLKKLKVGNKVKYQASYGDIVVNMVTKIKK